MKEAIFNKRGTKQIVNTGFKLFDKQTNCITTGNAICNTQFSSFIRPFSQCECNGFVRREGELMHFDLNPFKKWRVPSAIQDVLKDRERKDSVILYMFFTNNKEFGIEPFLWVLTSREHKLIRSSLVFGYKRWLNKRCEAATEVIKYITD